MMVGLSFRLETDEAHEDAVSRFLETDLAEIMGELPLTEHLVVRFGVKSFGVIVTFTDQVAEEAHPGDRIAAAIRDGLGNWLIGRPVVQGFDVLVSRVPAQR
jgi:hypothetical protein